MQTVEYRKKQAPLPACLESALPKKLRLCLDAFGVHRVEEIRLYRDRFASLTAGGKNHITDCFVFANELEEIFCALCKRSPYAYRESICRGYLSPGGGVRVGLAGRAILAGGQVLGVDDISGLVIRIPHSIPVDVEELLPLCEHGLLIYAPPGVGKTTLLCSLALTLSESRRTVLLDQKGEFSDSMQEGGASGLLHLLTGFPPALGIETAVRNLGAECILTDEIGSREEADCILSAANRGVPLVATAHAKNASELYLRPELRQLLDCGVFVELAGLSRNGYGKFSYALSSVKTP